MKPGELKINLKNIDEENINEYLITDGSKWTVYNPMFNIVQNLPDDLIDLTLSQHANITKADVMMMLQS